METQNKVASTRNASFDDLSRDQLFTVTTGSARIIIIILVGNYGLSSMSLK